MLRILSQLFQMMLILDLCEFEAEAALKLAPSSTRPAKDDC
jgi:hypothetical protein